MDSIGSIAASRGSGGTGYAISIAVAKKALDAIRMQGDQAIQMIAAAAEMTPGSSATDQSTNQIDHYA
ncbi:MAG: putative motility protein [Phycisphaerales bacterium]|nr:putative motility protein [Phycisphaerales bacterium]